MAGGTNNFERKVGLVVVKLDAPDTALDPVSEELAEADRGVRTREAPELW
jgi:hypothetical protein